MLSRMRIRCPSRASARYAVLDRVKSRDQPRTTEGERSEKSKSQNKTVKKIPNPAHPQQYELKISTENLSSSSHIAPWTLSLVAHVSTILLAICETSEHIISMFWSTSFAHTKMPAPHEQLTRPHPS